MFQGITKSNDPFESKYLVVDIRFLHMVRGTSIHFDDTPLVSIFDRKWEPPTTVTAIRHDITSSAFGNPIATPETKELNRSHSHHLTILRFFSGTSNPQLIGLPVTDQLESPTSQSDPGRAIGYQNCMGWYLKWGSV